MFHDVGKPTAIYAPYCSSYEHVFAGIQESDNLRDRWSIGVIVLEMLVGPELILARESFLQIEELYDQIEKHLDQSTRAS